MSVLRKKGRILITIEEFNQALDVLESKIRDGLVNLPLNIEGELIRLFKLIS